MVLGRSVATLPGLPQTRCPRIFTSLLMLFSANFVRLVFGLLRMNVSGGVRPCFESLWPQRVFGCNTLRVS